MISEIRVKLPHGAEGLAIITPSGNEIHVRTLSAVGGVLYEMLTSAQGQATQGLGTTAAPVQSMIDDWLRSGGVIRRAERQNAAMRKALAAEISLEDLGLL